ncbi:hypothetical protein WJX77_008776 [Trebouxia sp. C0004]
MTTTSTIPGALVLADFKTNTKAPDIKERGEVEEVRDVRDVLLKDDEFYGTYMYINFLHRFLEGFVCSVMHVYYE